MITPFICQNAITFCKCLGAVGQTHESVNEMFANQTIRIFGDMIEIELENGTLICYFKNDICSQTFFFSHDE